MLAPLGGDDQNTSGKRAPLAANFNVSELFARCKITNEVQLVRYIKDTLFIRQRTNP